MVVAVLKHIDARELKLEPDELDRICDRSRKMVILNGMSDLFVENLQALIIICFEDVSISSLSLAEHLTKQLLLTVLKPRSVTAYCLEPGQL